MPRGRLNSIRPVWLELLATLDLSHVAGRAWPDRVPELLEAAQGMRTRIAQLELANFRAEQLSESLEEELKSVRAHIRFISARAGPSHGGTEVTAMDLSKAYLTLEREVFIPAGHTLAAVYGRISADPAARALGVQISARMDALGDGGMIPERPQDDLIIGTAARALCELMSRPQAAGGDPSLIAEGTSVRLDGAAIKLLADLADTGCATYMEDSGDLRIEFHNEEERARGLDVLRANKLAV